MVSTQRNDVRTRMRLGVSAAVVVVGVLTLASSSAASADDDSGQESVGYVLERGRARTVVFPGAERTVAVGIDDHGEVVGKYTDAEGRDGGSCAPVGAATCAWTSPEREAPRSTRSTTRARWSAPTTPGPPGGRPRQ